MIQVTFTDLEPLDARSPHLFLLHRTIWQVSGS